MSYLRDAEHIQAEDSAPLSADYSDLDDREEAWRNGTHTFGVVTTGLDPTRPVIGSWQSSDDGEA